MVLWIELGPSKDLVQSKPPESVNAVFFGNRLFADVMKMRSHWALSPCDWCPYKKREIWTQRQRRTGRMPCEVGGRLESCCHKPRNTSDCWQAPAPRREAGNTSSLWVPKKEFTLLTPRFQTYGLLNSERINFCCLKLPNLWFSVMAALESNSTLSLMSSVTRIALHYALLGIIWFDLINIKTILRCLSLG